MEMEMPVKDTEQLTNGPKPGMHVWKLPGGGAEMILRPFNIVRPNLVTKINFCSHTT